MVTVSLNFTNTGETGILIRNVAPTVMLGIPNGKIIGLINKNNIVELKKCLIDWCLINYDGNLGWILKKNLWGVYKKETLGRNF